MKEEFMGVLESIKSQNLSYDDLAHLAASAIADSEELKKENTNLASKINQLEETLNVFSESVKGYANGDYKFNEILLHLSANGGNSAAQQLLTGLVLTKSQRAKDNAKESHVETYSLQDEVVEYWRKNIDPKLSGERAADILKKQFPLAHRTLKDYVLTEKAKLRNQKCTPG